jgi:hypothetical protein
LQLKSALLNKYWTLRAKWKLFAFIFPVIFPVNREFCESRELSALSTAPQNPISHCYHYKNTHFVFIVDQMVDHFDSLYFQEAWDFLLL